MSDIIKELKKHWVDAGLNGRSFAKQVGYSDRYVSLVVTGKTPFPAKWLSHLPDRFRHLYVIEAMKAAEERVRAAAES